MHILFLFPLPFRVPPELLEKSIFLLENHSAQGRLEFHHLCIGSEILVKSRMFNALFLIIILDYYPALIPKICRKIACSDVGQTIHPTPMMSLCRWPCSLQLCEKVRRESKSAVICHIQHALPLSKPVFLNFGNFKICGVRLPEFWEVKPTDQVAKADEH